MLRMRPAVLSSDLFDTVLLRDHTTEAERFALACRRAAPLLDVDHLALTDLRSSFHACAYRAVAMQRPEGDASLEAICRAVATSMGLDESAARILMRCEVDVDVEHLRPHRHLLDLYQSAPPATRLIAVSDMYYSSSELERIIEAVLGCQPFVAVYASSDIRSTKYSGTLYTEVAAREGVDGAQFLHVGDNYEVDVVQARRAGWNAVHLPRSASHRVAKAVGKMRAGAVGLRRPA